MNLRSLLFMAAGVAAFGCSSADPGARPNIYGETEADRSLPESYGTVALVNKAAKRVHCSGTEQHPRIVAFSKGCFPTDSTTMVKLFVGTICARVPRRISFPSPR